MIQLLCSGGNLHRNVFAQKVANIFFYFKFIVWKIVQCTLQIRLSHREFLFSLRVIQMHFSVDHRPNGQIYPIALNKITC